MAYNLEKNVKAFVESKCGKRCYAIFTGYTMRAFRSYIYLLDAWINADSDSKDCLELAMKNVLSTLQPGELPLAMAKWAIAGVSDYGFIDQLWPIIKPASLQE